MKHSLLVAVLGCLLLAWPVRADDPPQKNRPANFSDAVGSFRVTTEANPTTLRADEALTLTVRVTATTPPRTPPKRPNLRALPAFAERFDIEALSEPEGRHPDERTWEFVYRLKPRRADVDAVPSLPLVYYKPGPTPTARGGFQTAYADSIPLTIKPDGQPTTAGGVPTVAAPESAYQIAEGPAVLRRPVAWGAAGIAAAVLVLAGAPALCAGWYVFWRRLYPDAARLARIKHSQAARHALRSLRALRRLPAEDQAPRAADALTAYLRQRVDLAAAAPTPDEAAAALHAADCAERLTREVAAFFRDCDAARFAPAAAPGTQPWADTAARLVLEVEAELWPAQAS